MVVRSVGVRSVAVFCFVFYGFVGVIWSVYPVGVSPGIVSTPLLHVARFLNLPHGGFSWLFFIVVVPLIYAGAGFIIGGIAAILFNVAARITGGIRLDLG